MSIDPAARGIPARKIYKVKYSICTLVNHHDEYGEMVDSFIKSGFTAGDCEYLYIDNSHGNQAEAFAGYNQFLDAAQGQYVILCHRTSCSNWMTGKYWSSASPNWTRSILPGGWQATPGEFAPHINAVRITHPIGGQTRAFFPQR